MRKGTRFTLALGKALGAVSRGARIGGGSTFPGKVARKLYAGFVSDMTGGLSQGCLLVTGTNGKTTTSTLLASILEEKGTRPVHNRTGANLMAGIASCLIGESDLSGNLAGELGLFEVDEAALLEAVKETNPKLVLVNNLFRDQLDRYGELDTLASSMREAVRNMDLHSTVVLNADDPLVASIGEGLGQEVVYFGIESDRYASGAMEHAADSKYCASCGESLSYEYHLFGHLGSYRCDSCGLVRPRPRVAVTRLEMLGMEGTRCRVSYPGGTIDLHVPLPGLYNVYNAAAAMTVALSLGVEPPVIAAAVERFSAAFGRVEKVEVRGRELLMILAKNPAGFNEVIRTLTEEPVRKNVVLALNDNIADGRDVSWIWDVDFEMFRGHLGDVVCSGIRAWDMALRVKYAGLQEESLAVEPDLNRALDVGLESVSDGETVFVIPTYTAMLDLRKTMARKGLVTPFWES